MMGPILFWPFISTHSHIDIILYTVIQKTTYPITDSSLLKKSKILVSTRCLPNIGLVG